MPASTAAALVLGVLWTLQSAAATPRVTRKPATPARKPASAARKPAPAPSTAPPPLVDGAATLDPFFRALLRLADAPTAAATPEVVRVLHFGDSHTSADMWTGRLRARLQARFGDAGPGLLLPARPWRGFAHAGVDLEFGRKWPATSLREAGTDGLVGLTGAALMLPEQEALRVRGFFRGFEVTTHASGSAGPDVGLVRSEPAPATPAGAAALLSPEVLTCAPTHTALRLESGGLLRIDAQRGLSDEAPLELRVSVPVGDRLLGIELFSGRPGLLYDELGLNGAEVTDLLRWNAEVRRLLLARARADLIVLAYGTNEMGRNAGELAVYAEQVRQILATLRAESGAPILVIGPIDRGSRRSSLVRRLRISEPLVGAALRSAAIRSGAAYWDARSAMGGAGSITRWQRQGMAQRDLVHLTGRGYERLGDLLADALLLAFDDYRARQAAALSPAAPAGGFP